MAKYDKKSQEKVKTSMEEFKEGKLKSGSGKKVTNPKQAIAIGLSEARKNGSKAPEKAKGSPAGKKSGTTSTSSAKTASAKKASPRKAAPKNNTSKNTTAKKSTAKATSASKPATKAKSSAKTKATSASTKSKPGKTPLKKTTTRASTTKKPAAKKNK